MTTIGRNEPCPCGSGRKYKHCCLASGKYEKVIPLPVRMEMPDEFKTGTPLDDYTRMMMQLMVHTRYLAGQPDGKTLARLVQMTENYEPTPDGGIPLSLLYSAQCCDFRYGETGETVAERFLQERQQHLSDADRKVLTGFSNSYAAFYEVGEVTPEYLVLRELPDDREWRVRRVNEPEGLPIECRDIWYLRLVGQPRDAYIYTPPEIYEPASKPDHLQCIKEMEAELASIISGVPLEYRHAEMWKQAIWGHFASEDPLFRAVYDYSGGIPLMRNMEGEGLSFTTLTFAVLDAERVKLKLNRSAQFDADEAGDSWRWLKNLKQPLGIMDSVTRATLTIKDSELVAETNSLERAMKLKKKLDREFAGLLEYRKMESKDMSEIPEPLPEERERTEREVAELNADPKVRKMIQEHQRKHYLEQWINESIPALGNRKPRDVVKTEVGRAEVAELLDTFEEQERRAQAPHQFDFNLLRAKLGLPMRERDKRKG